MFRIGFGVSYTIIMIRNHKNPILIIQAPTLRSSTCLCCVLLVVRGRVCEPQIWRLVVLDVSAFNSGALLSCETPLNLDCFLCTLNQKIRLYSGSSL